MLAKMLHSFSTRCNHIWRTSPLNHSAAVQPPSSFFPFGTRAATWHCCCAWAPFLPARETMPHWLSKSLFHERWAPRPFRQVSAWLEFLANHLNLEVSLLPTLWPQLFAFHLFIASCFRDLTIFSLMILMVFWKGVIICKTFNSVNLLYFTRSRSGQVGFSLGTHFCLLVKSTKKI